jgi:hypothetical protein
MWNLTADDLQRAKEELKGRRAAIQARYENELKHLEVDIADLETFERFAVKFVSDFKGAEPPVLEAAEPTPEVEAVVAAANVVAEPDNQADAVAAEMSGEKVEAVASADTGVRKGTSRWRMHLSAGEASA